MTAAPSSPDPLAFAYGECEDLIRRGDRDRWLASLFAPAPLRRHLHAMYAFNLEIGRVREIVSDPLPGEVRYQWWRDALEGEARGDVKAHPIAAALIDTIARFRLPRAAFVNLVEARLFDLYDDPMPTLNDLEGYCGETSSTLIRLAALVLSRTKPDAINADAAGHAGVAFAITGLLRALPWHTARGQVYIPLDVLGRYGASREDMLAGQANEAIRAALADMRSHARRHLAEAKKRLKLVAPEAKPAFLPISLVEPYLRQMERPGYDPFRTVIEMPQWRRQWILWRASRR